jgi:hypothetical protein
MSLRALRITLSTAVISASYLAASSLLRILKTPPSGLSDQVPVFLTASSAVLNE